MKYLTSGIYFQHNVFNYFLPSFKTFYLYSSSLLFKRNFFYKGVTLCPYITKEHQESSEIDKLKVSIKEWLERRKEAGEFVPQIITEEEFQTLIDAHSWQQRRKHMDYLHRISKIKEKRRLEKMKIKMTNEKILEERKENNSGHISYGLWNNSMFAKVTKQAIIYMQYKRLVSAALYGQSLVIDLGFGDYMNTIEKAILFREVTDTLGCNKNSQNPFNIMICNVEEDSEIIKRINKKHRSIPITITSKSYLDIFPKENLVYLTANARDEMVTFDHNAVYIIGGLVDHGIKHPVTFMKAEKEGIKMLKLPLKSSDDCKLQEDITLNIPHVFSILSHLQETGDWKKAFNVIPNWRIHFENHNAKKNKKKEQSPIEPSSSPDGP